MSETWTPERMRKVYDQVKNWGRWGPDDEIGTLNFISPEDIVESIDDQWEIGLALGRGGKGVKIWFLTFEHVGLSYKFSSNGRYKAITFNLRSPFTY